MIVDNLVDALWLWTSLFYGRYYVIMDIFILWVILPSLMDDKIRQWIVDLYI